MASKPIQVTDPWELMGLMSQNAMAIATMTGSKVSHPLGLDLTKVTEHLDRTREIFISLKEHIAAARAEFERREAEAMANAKKVRAN